MVGNPSTLNEALLASAMHNAGIVFRDRKSEDFHTKLGAAVAAGVAVELFVKYLLACKSPVYLPELKPSSEERAIRSRELLATNPVRYHAGLAEVQSIQAMQAVGMAHHLYKDFKLSDLPLKFMLDTRNAAAHLAIAPTSEQLEDVVYGVVTLFDNAKQNGHIRTSPFAGNTTEADRFIRDYREQKQGFVLEKIKEAKAEAKLLQSLESQDTQRTVDGVVTQSEIRETVNTEEADRFLTLTQAQLEYDASSYRDEEVRSGELAYKCPACGKRDANVLYDIVVDVDVDENGSYLFTETYPYAFACGRCVLTLSTAELRTLNQSDDGWATRLFKIIESKQSTP